MTDQEAMEKAAEEELQQLLLHEVIFPAFVKRCADQGLVLTSPAAQSEAFELGLRANILASQVEDVEAQQLGAIRQRVDDHLKSAGLDLVAIGLEQPKPPANDAIPERVTQALSRLFNKPAEPAATGGA